MEEEGAEEGGEGSDEKGKGMLSPTSETNDSEASNTVTRPAETPDVADRAAAMLEGLQGGLNTDGSLSVRRRRESADTERERRRRRRQQASSAKTEDGGLLSPTIPEEGEERRGSVFSGDEGTAPGTPTIGVHPPSPEGKADRDTDVQTPPPPEWS
jgi:cytokinesis protein